MVNDQDNTLWLNYLLLFKNSVYCIIVSKGSNSSLAKLWHMFSCYHFFFLGGIYGRPYAIRPTQPNYCSHPNTTTLLISSCSISVIINTFFITTNHHHHHHHKHLSLSLSLIIDNLSPPSFFLSWIENTSCLNLSWESLEVYSTSHYLAISFPFSTTALAILFLPYY